MFALIKLQSVRRWNRLFSDRCQLTREREVLLDMCSPLRPPGDSVAAQVLAGGQAGGGKWAYCTWGRHCGSLTILADTSCEKHGNMDTLQARPCCETPLNTPHMFDQEGSVSSPLLSKQPHYNHTVLLHLVAWVWTGSSRRWGWAWGWRGRCPGWWYRHWAAGGRAPQMSFCSWDRSSADHTHTRNTTGQDASNVQMFSWQTLRIFGVVTSLISQSLVSTKAQLVHSLLFRFRLV